MDLSSWYPSSTAIEPAAAPDVPEATVTSPEPQSSPVGDRGVPAEHSEAQDDGGVDLDAKIDAAIDAAETSSIDMTVDERRDWFEGVRQTEPAATGVSDYFAATRMPASVRDLPSVQQALGACVGLGIGQSEMTALMSAVKEGTVAPIRTSPEAARAALTLQWGDATDRNLAAANRFVDALQSRWPGVRYALDRTGLSNDPRFIARMAQHGRNLN